jgi:hypothetical protein
MTSPPARDARSVACAGSLMMAVTPSPSRAHGLAPLTMLHHTRPLQPPPSDPIAIPLYHHPLSSKRARTAPAILKLFLLIPQHHPPLALPIHSSTTRTMMRSVDTFGFFTKISANAPAMRPMTRARRPPAAPASRRVCRASAVWSRCTHSGTVRPRSVRSLIRCAWACGHGRGRGRGRGCGCGRQAGFARTRGHENFAPARTAARPVWGCGGVRLARRSRVPSSELMADIGCQCLCMQPAQTNTGRG